MKDNPDDQSDGRGTPPDTPPADKRVPEEAEWELVAQTEFGSDTSLGLTTTIVRLVAEAEGLSPRDVKHPPLYDVVDTAALEAAFCGPEEKSQAQDQDASTEFMYHDFRIVVRSDGWVHLHAQIE